MTVLTLTHQMTCLRLLVLLAFLSVARAAVYSTLLPGFACTKQDETCAALGDLYVSTNGPGWVPGWASTSVNGAFAGWMSAAAGATQILCTFVMLSRRCSHHIHRNGQRLLCF